MSITGLVYLLIYLVVIWLAGGITIVVANAIAPPTAGIIRKIVIAICGVISLILLLLWLIGGLPLPHPVIVTR